MEKVYYNKLIRDKIPEVMASKGKKFEVRALNNDEFERELIKKVGEEASGLEAANSKEELISELADVLAVINEIKKFKKISEEEVKDALAKNFDRKGGFDKRIFLVWSEGDDYKSNERRYPQSIKHEA
jgi:predicted house-cleaning noncanonical NTP pyrophosphatase (MazG superfamily)